MLDQPRSARAQSANCHRGWQHARTCQDNHQLNTLCVAKGARKMGRKQTHLASCSTPRWCPVWSATPTSNQHWQTFGGWLFRDRSWCHFLKDMCWVFHYWSELREEQEGRECCLRLGSHCSLRELLHPRYIFHCFLVCPFAQEILVQHENMLDCYGPSNMVFFLGGQKYVSVTFQPHVKTRLLLLLRTPSVPNYKSLWLFWYIEFAMYLDITYV